MGDKYASSYSQGLKLLHAKKISLANNRLHDIGSLNVLNGLGTDT